MADFDKLITGLVSGVAKPMVASLMKPVTHERYVTRSRQGKPEYSAPVIPSPTALCLSLRTRTITTSDDATITLSGPITFLENYDVSVLDRLTLPDGSTGVIREISGTYTKQVWIGPA